MTGLIEEIQRDASDDGTPVSQLLRRMKIAAAKLKLPQLEVWVEHELGGYPDGAELPDYRFIGGVPMSLHVMHGWRVMGPSINEKMNQVFSFNQFTGSVAEVERHADSKGSMIISYPEWLERPVVLQMPGVSKLGLSVDPGKFRALLSGVRNRALDWALAAEAAGISGEGLSFNADEQKAAQGVTYKIYGDNARINQNSTDNSTNTVVHGDLFGALKARISSDVAEGPEREELLAAVSEMEAEKGKPGYAAAFARFMGLGAKFIETVQPFIEGLSSLVDH